VGGSHGKTTATAMIANVLIQAGKNPTVFLGGEDYAFGNFRLGQNIAVAEACEYKKNITDLKSKIGVVLNVDCDHMDSYKDIGEIKSTFADFVDNSIAVVNADDENCKDIFNSTTVSFGVEKLATYQARRIKKEVNGYSFSLYVHGLARGRIKLLIDGKHNVYNALATIAVCDMLGVKFSDIKAGLEKFCGVKRRNELLGNYKGLNFFADYAHHPKEIKATLLSFKEKREEYIMVFQPHTYSRTKFLMEEFIEALKDEKLLIVYKTYPAREEYDMAGSAKTLYERIKRVSSGKVLYVEDEKELYDLIEKNRLGYDGVLFLGAGDIYYVAQYLLKELH
jgi:UDP-N-acetylmuramate--alanine ligase